MSFFNQYPVLYNGQPVTSGLADTRYAHDDVHDAELGRSTKFHTPRQREFYLKRHPEMVGKLPPVQDPNRAPTWDDCSTVNGTPANLTKKYERLGREASLLRDRATNMRRVEPTRPTARTPERTVGVAFHEAWHCAAALHNGVRVLSTTIVRDGDADGLTTMLLNRKENPTVNAFISIAAEVGDQKAESNLHPATYDHDRDIGGSLEWREGVRRMVLEQLHEFTGGAMEIARQLMAKRTLNEAEINAAFVRGQAQATKAVTKKARTIRRVDFSNPEHVREWNIQMGRDPNSEPVGYPQGYIVPGSYKR
jgi:hypothetical protein